MSENEFVHSLRALAAPVLTFSHQWIPEIQKTNPDTPIVLGTVLISVIPHRKRRHPHVLQWAPMQSPALQQSHMEV